MNFYFVINKSLLIIGFISILISTLYAITKRHIWEGQFQIVLSQTSNQPNLKGENIEFDLSNLISSSNIDLKTDVEILKSPFVLAPVFNYVQAEKGKGNRKKEILVYSKWLNKNLQLN